MLAGILCGAVGRTDDAPMFPHAVVAADHPAASQAGLEILQQGGNVVDAAVATSFALSVVRPASCGVGGGGFMVIWNARRRRAVAIDYRETAPAKAHRDMFSDAEGTEPASVRGGMAVAVPGTVAGLCYAAEHYGTLPLSDLLAPAIRLARCGVVPDEHDERTRQRVRSQIARSPGYADRYRLLAEHYLQNGSRREGRPFRSPQLSLLGQIARNGPDAFYRGRTAEAIVSAVQQHGGILTKNDLATYRPRVRPALSASFREATVYTMPPPSGGGVALLQSLQTLEAWEQRTGRTLEDLGHNRADYVHVVTEAMKHAFADRAAFAGDADFTAVPVARLLSRRYAEETARRIDLRHTSPPETYGRFFVSADGGTSHFSVIDSCGNAVACTETINLAYGSFVVVPDGGIVLNNEMDDFSTRPGRPNAFGLLQSEANAISPGRRPLSSMTPTIVVRDGRAVLAAGGSGGPRIISATLQVVLNRMLFDMSPAAAVAAPRFHHQWFPDVLGLEPELNMAVGDALRRRGHHPSLLSGAGVSQAVVRCGTHVAGGSDPRKQGRPAGY